MTKYTIHVVIPTDPTINKIHEDNMKAWFIIMNNLSNSMHKKVMHCKIAYDVWEKLKKIYEGDTEVKLVKLQVLREKFEGLTMTEEEKIVDYLQRVDDVVNSIKGYGVDLKEEYVLKIFKSMTTKYDGKICHIEEEKLIKLLLMRCMP